MVTVSQDRFFHLRGRHVQHSHGRSSIVTDEPHSGAMIALMPTEEDARRLKLNGGEKAGDLHVTLYYLGEASEWPEHDRQSVINSVIDSFPSHDPAVTRLRIDSRVASLSEESPTLRTQHGFSPFPFQ